MGFEEFLELVGVLLGENGCPWDREQTHESLRQHMIEECYEAVEAINCGDMAALRDELGDVLLQVVFHAKLAEKSRAFDISDVIAGISQKLISRHTHVFGADSAASGADVVKIWEANKEKERNDLPKDAMNAVPRALPALMRASKVLKRSKREFPPVEQLFDEICAKLESPNIQSKEFGEILLGFVAIANALNINAELSLITAVDAVIDEA